MNVDAQRLDILQYYINGKVYNPIHNKTIIGELQNLDYLRCGITSNLEETIMTTDYGLIYLDISGIIVDTPIIVGGRLQLRSLTERKIKGFINRLSGQSPRNTHQ